MLIIGIAGPVLSAEEAGWMQHEGVRGVILFDRNIVDREQTVTLVEAIRSAAPRPMLLCVDQEGGPVQRFREGYCELPALARIGEIFADDADRAVIAAREHGWLMASEMRAIGMDLSFAPVVDLRCGNRAIGDRAFSADPAVVSTLAKAYIDGMHQAGMASTIKHFPGHGSVLEDTHHDDAADPRPLAEIEALDLAPFAATIKSGADAVMMAHVVYPAVDDQAAGYSKVWIGDILRGQLGFDGAVFSDDIGMAAAKSAGGVAERVRLHLDAGCDAVLVCHPNLVPESLDALRDADLDRPAARLERLTGRPAGDWDALAGNRRAIDARAKFGHPLGADESGNVA